MCRKCYCIDHVCGIGKRAWLLLASDGLFANEARGGGGGLSNAEVSEFVAANSSLPLDQLAEKLTRQAQAVGSTDDITVVVAKLE